MEISEVIKIREVFKKVKYDIKRVNKETGEVTIIQNSLPLHIKLDNEVHIFETNMNVFWDDTNGILYYYAYNSQESTAPGMYGINKIIMPAMLCAATYEQIQEIRVILNEDTLIKTLNVLSEEGVKYYVTDEGKTIDDKARKIILTKYCADTEAQRDYDMHLKETYNK